MSANEIVVRLIQGSENLEQMKRRTECLVRTVISMALDIFLRSGETKFNRVFDLEICRWTVDLQRTDLRHERISVMCSILSGNLEEVVVWELRSHIVTHAKLAYVQLVFKSLPSFITGMIEAFPNLKESWRPLIDASYVNFGIPTSGSSTKSQEDLLLRPVTRLDLSVLARNTLRHLNIQTIGELVKLSRNSLSRNRYATKMMILEIERLLEPLGLKLADDSA